MDFLRGKASLRLLSLYTCDDCRGTQTGDSVTIEIAAFTNLLDLVDMIHKKPNRAQDMPVGWASYAGPKRNHYRCAACMDKGKVV
jgi:hypothetical protein